MKVYEKQNPHLFDVPITEIEHSLQTNCEWLDTIFGRCERLVKEINGKKYYSANWFLGGKEYVRVAPDEGLGNFAFFVLDEPTDLESYFRGDVTKCSIGFALIIWADMRKMTTDRDTESIKEEIITLINKHTFLHNGRVTINRIFERAENVFREFDYDEIDNQFLMHPFAGFRFEGELIVDTLCDAYIPPTPQPYIAGHVTDGSKTLTFKVNGNENIIVPIDSKGNWIWYVDREIRTLYQAFYYEHGEFLDCITLSNLNLSIINNFEFAFSQSEIPTTSNYRILDMSKCKGAISATTNYLTYRVKTLWYMPNIDLPLNNTTLQSQSDVRACGYIKANCNFGNLTAMTQAAIISLFDAVAADNITFTFSAAMGAMIDSAMADTTSYIYQAYWAADTRGYHINYVY